MQVINENSLREFYAHVYPVELVTQWLSYRLSQPRLSAGSSVAVVKGEPTAVSGEESKDGVRHVLGIKAEPCDAVGAAAGADDEDKEWLNGKGAAAAEGYLARREFCFTLIGDIFTRFRSYRSSEELRAELVRCFPEKIDVGAVYNIRPNQKQGLANVFPVERELVFDIDMSDYDNVRSCCSGKSICSYCWAWMSCAAHVLHTVLRDDFGFKYILPVFSGRRGIHLWVCDRRARRMTNDERTALVGYLTVVAPKTLRSTIVADLANHRLIHPTIRHVLRTQLDRAFTSLFVASSSDNPNNIQHHPTAAYIVHDATSAVLKLGRRDALNRFQQHVHFQQGNVLDWATYLRALGSEQEATDILHAVQLLLMYPRLDEHVSTRRDHLLKLPFCVHPGTASLCCPLEWDEVDGFHPTEDAPKLHEMLLSRSLDVRWTLPLERMLKDMRTDEDENSS
ncbi:putative DNA primase small subunit [Leishmania major strain Friedlin]|uniref:DNA primase n=1 Tax=Leishmania major TaxID=5664 RepID=Q4QBV6_LEIMA|nr:putative DNA primase small subunit [Leishmania major strain Friedlin]CAG9573907.1 DNA_primase_small_subunit_-_putative [Leishmania major strain Friedlin]CAJ04048.1 putative DNA primase small subunit [Leishmania major strain Friedlin]|eukprot:XP_001683192.1 putative DNA primase small subunit [Leishmania major strain Friedlin]